MFANVQQILQSYGPIGVEVLKQAISQVEATGKTAQSIRFETESTEKKDRLLLIGRAYFELIEKGIRPSGKNPSPEMIEFMTEYAKARGIDNPKSAAWGMSKTILNKGDKTYRSGGRLVYSPELIKFVEEVKDAIVKEFKRGYLLEIKGAFKGGSNN